MKSSVKKWFLLLQWAKFIKLYNIACGKDWKKFKLGDHMFHKLAKKSQEFREDTFFEETYFKLWFAWFSKKQQQQQNQSK